MPKKNGYDKERHAGIRSGKISKSDVFEAVRGGSTLKTGTIRRSVTFAADVDQRAHQLVGARGFSAFVNEATRAALQFAATDRLITNFEAEHGAVTDHELNRARSTLRQARQRRG